MTEQTEHPQTNSGEGGERQESAGALRIKAEHRQQMAQMEMQHLDMLLADQPLAVRVYFDPVLFKMWEDRARLIAESNSVPEHLRGDVGACMNVLDRSLAWRMSPWMVAQGQYTARKGATPGYFGRVIIAAINGSGKLDGGLSFEFFAEGDASWDNVLGKFESRPSKRQDPETGESKTFQVATYTDSDERGLGVIVRGQLKGEEAPRELKVYMRQCHPRNSVLWAVDPKTQLIYTAGRRFGNAYVPELLMGVRTDDDPIDDAGASEEREMRDVTPKAPPPVDLAAEGIAGQGHMSEADEKQQREAARVKEEGQRPAAEAAADVAAKAGTLDRGHDAPETAPGRPQDGDPASGQQTTGENASGPSEPDTPTNEASKRGRRSNEQIKNDLIQEIRNAQSVAEVAALLETKDYANRDSAMKAEIDAEAEAMIKALRDEEPDPRQGGFSELMKD